MKRLIFITALLMAWIGAIKADEIVVPNIVIPKGGTAILDIQLNNEQELNRTFGFFINLPEGVTVVDKSEKLGERFNGTKVDVVGTLENDGRYKIMAVNGITDNDNYPIPNNSGTIVTVELAADESIDEGTVLDASIENIEINLFFKESESTPSDVPTTANFQITIDEPSDGRTLFDETSDNADVLKSATNVDVRVLRTIKANEWSTIVLPFSMTSEQVVKAFGSDVQLADFSSWAVTEEDEDGEPTAIGIGFTTLSANEGMKANHPYLIKTTAPVSEFNADGVTIVIPEDAPTVTVGKESKQGKFIGTYQSGSVVPEEKLFLSGNKFCYSTGKSAIKPFRAYFDLKRVLISYYDESEARITMTFDNEMSGIRSMTTHTENGLYDLQGRRYNSELKNSNYKKGVYVRNGKKVIVK